MQRNDFFLSFFGIAASEGDVLFIGHGAGRKEKSAV